MLDLPLHDISDRERNKFKEFLISKNKIDLFYIIELKDIACLFSNLSFANSFKQYNQINSEIIQYSDFEKINYNHLLVNPCVYCRSSSFETTSKEVALNRLYEQDFIENLYLDEARKNFEIKNLPVLFELSKSILEHYNPDSALAHFYLGFCFFMFEDTENFEQAKNNLSSLDAELYLHLTKLKKLP